MIERVRAGGDAVVVVGPEAGEVGAAVRAARERDERVGGFVVTDDHDGAEAALTEMISELYGSAAERSPNT